VKFGTGEQTYIFGIKEFATLETCAPFSMHPSPQDYPSGHIWQCTPHAKYSYLSVQHVTPVGRKPIFGPLSTE